MTPSPLVARLLEHGVHSVHGQRVAVVDADRSLTYAALLRRAASTADVLRRAGVGPGDRVALAIPRSADYAVALLGTWGAGAVAVPLPAPAPPATQTRTVEDCQPRALLGRPRERPEYEPWSRHQALPIVMLPTGDALGSSATWAPRRRRDPALMVYTSGTTGRPKGVVLTHGNLEAQVETLRVAWGWRKEDRVLCVLPLHHVHGIINVVASAQWAGASCEFAARFDPELTWDRLAGGEITVFMAVPTIYHKLMAAWEASSRSQRRSWQSGASRLRLMVSGSAALPVREFERWREITGHALLERYGMTEIGMALSNPLHGERRPGYVGQPLPGVEVRRRADDGTVLAPDDVAPGELEVRGPGVFAAYWQRPDATAAAFRDGWFQTGDIAVVEGGDYRLLGRRSVDIIKTGGYKVSALEIEAELGDQPEVGACAVVGVADDVWGEVVAAAIVPRRGAAWDLDRFRDRLAQVLVDYKLPREIRVVDALPRNALGKIDKPAVKRLFRPSS